MNFNSPEFLIFLPTVLLIFAAVRRNRLARDLFLLVTSYAFYMSWNWRYAGLIACSTLVDYVIGRRIGASERPALRRFLLGVSLTVNLGLLAVFKYFNFFADAMEETGAVFGFDLALPHHRLLLPVGISFYTFQTLSYTIDLYRRAIPVERNLLRFAVFVSFFPQLVAGPIVRASQFLPQLKHGPRVDGNRFDEGSVLVFRGLFKKIVIADLLAGLGVDAVFANPSSFSSWDLLFGLYGYAFQIYNDFSGYTDIAIGTARMLGFDIPENFRKPYLAKSMREFWRRWHITLSTWLRDYLYISLGGNQKGARRIGVNLLLTMLLGGLWHGASMNFVLWGAYHGILLMVSRWRGTPPTGESLARTWLRRLGCFHLVLFGWLLFRVTGMENFEEYVRGLFEFSGGTRLHTTYYAVLALGIATHLASWDAFAGARRFFLSLPVPIQACVYSGLLFAYSAATLGAPAFIYFQF